MCHARGRFAEPGGGGTRAAPWVCRRRVTEQSEPQAEPIEVPRPPRPRSPLIIGAIAYGLLIWMVMVVCLLIAWKLSLR